MKKKILVLVSTFLLAFLFIAGCSNKQDNNSQVKIGKYFGETFKLTSSFMPILTLEKNNKFEFELGVSKSIQGTYTINNNNLVLTSSKGDESYTLSISNNTLVIQEEIPNFVNKSTIFKFAGKE